MHGPKRGRATGLGNPCPKRTSPYPHVRVNRGQPFPIAWSSGHGGPTYIVLVHAEDEDKLKLNRINGQEIPKQYLYEAPPEAVERYSDLFWDKTHWGWMGRGGKAGAVQNEQVFERRGWKQIRPGHPNFPNMMRGGTDDFWASQLSKDETNSMWQMDEKNPMWTQGRRCRDQRAAYTNPKWPWLQAVWVSCIRAHMPRQYHIQKVDFPRTLTRTGPHVVHFMWRGYTGCVDVDVLPDHKPLRNTSKEMVGYPTPDGRGEMYRINHANFDIGSYYLANIDPRLRPTGGHGREYFPGCWVVPPPGEARSSQGYNHQEALSHVLEQCVRKPPSCRTCRWSTCDAVVCTPLELPPLVRFSERNYPLRERERMSKTECPILDASREPPGSQVCYGLYYEGDNRASNAARRLWGLTDLDRGPHDGRIGDAYTISDDPRDEAFYSTTEHKTWEHASHHLRHWQ